MENVKEMQKEQEQKEKVDAQKEKEDATFSFDYDKLASIINGRQASTEDKVLKGYFTEQGLSADEMKQAIDSFKAQKAKNTPDIGALQSQIAEATKRATQAEIQSQGMLLASELGVDVKAMPFIIRMADLAEVTAKDGKVDNAKLKDKLEEVVKAIPSFKASAQTGGFQKVGADTSDKDGNKADDAAIAKAFGIKTK